MKTKGEDRPLQPKERSIERVCCLSKEPTLLTTCSWTWSLQNCETSSSFLLEPHNLCSCATAARANEGTLVLRSLSLSLVPSHMLFPLPAHTSAAESSASVLRGRLCARRLTRITSLSSQSSTVFGSKFLFIKRSAAFAGWPVLTGELELIPVNQRERFHDFMVSP